MKFPDVPHATRTHIVSANLSIPKRNLANLIDFVYLNLTENSGNINYMVGRAILTPKNIDVEIISDNIINRLSGKTKIYPSLDSIDSTENTSEQQSQVYSSEFLRSLKISDLPPGKLKLKIGILIILLQNLNPSEGLCNGTRLIIRDL
ncbi:ATP-dependent DNA helicase Pif1-like [Rhizophagus clarus]|uniref:ATP-dependent DNA helicase Pif1-like n=2 Tax=Rhizophagus clarus TaxID=94130 RepID=A0A8H3M9R5_9GLOM|nr:ATP-dependent DNA helicase Pif1-like [Rhizophagus clarus]